MRRRLKWIIIGQLGLLLFIWLNIVLWGGRYFDSVCIEGRLSAEQAQTINNEQWGKCPSLYGNCEAEENDRVLRYACSAFSRNLFLFDTITHLRRAFKERSYTPTGTHS